MLFYETCASYESAITVVKPEFSFMPQTNKIWAPVASFSDTLRQFGL